MALVLVRKSEDNEGELKIVLDDEHLRSYQDDAMEEIGSLPNPVDEIISSIVSGIGKANELALPFIESSSISNASKGHLINPKQIYMDHRVKAIAKDSIKHLQEVSARVQQLHMMGMLDDRGSTTMPREAFSHFLWIKSDLDTFVTRLQTADTKEDVLTALRSFVEDAKWWIDDTTSSMNLLISTTQLSNLDLHEKLHSTVESKLFRRSQSLTANFLCPLEQVVARSIVTPHRIYPFESFISWVEQEAIHSVIHPEIGTVQSMHLYRSRKAPLYHEYALISFGKGEELTSWMRVERAAQPKNSPFTPRDHSSGSLHRGITLRESVSFSRLKADLSHNSDELAIVVLEAPKDSSAMILPISLDELTRELKNTSRSSPKYKLLSANCRWFARRNLLNFGQRLEQLNANHRITWQGALITLQGVEKKLQEETFGGSLLGGEKGMHLRAQNLITSAKRVIERGCGVEEAIVMCQQSLSSLENVESSTLKHRHLVASSLHTMGDAFAALDRFPDALHNYQRSTDLMRGIQPDHKELLANTLLGTSSTLAALRRYQEAYAVHTEVVELRKNMTDTSEGKRNLALELVRYGSYMCKLPGRHEDAAKSNRIGVTLMRVLYADEPEATRSALITALSMSADPLSTLETTAQGLSDAREAVSLARVTLVQRVDLSSADLALQLYKLGSHLYAHNQNIEASQALQEAADLYCHLYQVDSDRYRMAFSAVLELRTIILHAIGNIEQASDTLSQALTLSPVGNSHIPLQKRATMLRDLGSYRRRSGRASWARIPFNEALRLIWPLYLADSPGNHESLVTIVQEYGLLLFDLGECV